MMWAFLKPDAKHIFDSPYEFTLKARAALEKLNRAHKFSERPHVGREVGHLTLAKNLEQFASFACLSVRDVNIFGSAQMNLRIPCFGTLADVPFGMIALADFCDGLAHKSLVDNVELFLNGSESPSERQIRGQIKALTSQGYGMLYGGGMAGHPLTAEVAATMTAKRTASG